MFGISKTKISYVMGTFLLRMNRLLRKKSIFDIASESRKREQYYVLTEEGLHVPALGAVGRHISLKNNTSSACSTRNSFKFFVSAAQRNRADRELKFQEAMRCGFGCS